MKRIKIINAPNTPQVNGEGYYEFDDGSGGSGYVLTPATNNSLGGVKARPKTSDDVIEVSVNSDGRLFIPEPEEPKPYELKKASDVLGGLKATDKTVKDTVPVRIDESGYLWVEPSEVFDPYVLPEASETSLGGVKVKTSTSDQTDYVGIDGEGKLRVRPQGNYTLPEASSSELGGVKVIKATEDMTDFVGINESGLLVVHDKTDPYSLPLMSTGVRGGAQAPPSGPEHTEIVSIDSNTGYLKYKAVAGEIGPPGKDGAPGKDGIDGKDGKDGLNADQLPDPIIHTETIKSTSPDTSKMYLPFTREIIIDDETKVFARNYIYNLPQTLTVYKSGKFILEVPFDITIVPEYSWIDKINIEYQSENAASNFRNLWGLAKQFYDFAEVSTGTTTLAWSVPGKASTIFTDVNYLVSDIYQPIPAKLLDELMYKFTGTFPKEILDLFIES